MSQDPEDQDIPVKEGEPLAEQISEDKVSSNPPPDRAPSRPPLEAAPVQAGILSSRPPPASVPRPRMSPSPDIPKSLATEQAPPRARSDPPAGAQDPGLGAYSPSDEPAIPGSYESLPHPSDSEESEGHVANPIRAMRVIKLEEHARKNPPSASSIETSESTFEQIEEGLDDQKVAQFGSPPSPKQAPADPSPALRDEEEAVEEVESVEEVALSVSHPAIPAADRKPPPPRRSARPSLPKATTPRKKPWWETLFGDDFSRAYRPMTQRQLSREVDFILESLELPRGGVILDLACGQGEICVELARRGYSVVGYDLSVYQLAMAGDNAQQARQRINFLQGDMREMAFEEMFDAVICWDTSFGYFEDEKNVEVLHRVKKALKPSGRFLLDVMNRDFAAREAPYNHWFEGDGCVCMDDMSLDYITNRLRVKRSIILDDGRSKELHYATRLYTLSEIGRMLHDSGFRVAKVSGDIVTKGAFFGPNSRRIIIQAGKP